MQMKNEVMISVNQLANFTKATDAKKKSILRQQKNPPKVIVAHYALAKARIRKAISSRGDISPILNGISELKNKVPTSKWQVDDKRVSIEAMERFIRMKLPVILKSLDSYEILKKFQLNSFVFSGVNIIVSPDIIIKGTIGEKTYIGAIKIHVSKSSPFDKEQSKYVATCIYDYLKTFVKDSNIIVTPKLCFCIDVFADSIISAPPNITHVNSKIEDFCREIISLWDVA